MGQLEDLRLFVQILESGSISKAANKLSLAKSAISRRLTLLEDRYQARLIDRSPGTWRVTQTGEELYQRALHVIDGVNEIDADFVSLSADLSGPLSITIPRDFGLAHLNTALSQFKTEYPQIALTADLDDRIVDLTQENYDFALRITEPSNETDNPRRIGSVGHALYASRKYIEAHGKPNDIDDLKDHPLLFYGRARRASWMFRIGKKSIRFVFQPTLNSNSGLFLLDATLNGLGISRLPDFLVKDAMDDQLLVQLLPEVHSPELGIFLIHQNKRHMNRRMRIFAEAMKQACMPGN